MRPNRILVVWLNGKPISGKLQVASRSSGPVLRLSHHRTESVLFWYLVSIEVHRPGDSRKEMSESTEPVHEGVDEFIVDPIRVSLLATIDDEHTAYNDPNKTDRSSLFEAKTIDIWESKTRGAKIVDRSYPVSRRLPEGLFEASHPSIPRGCRLALRLLATRPALGSNQTARHDDLGPPDDRQINYLPFIPSEVQDLIHQWDLNREFTWMRLNSREVGNFQRKTVWNFEVEPPRAIRMGKHFCFLFLVSSSSPTMF